MPYALFSNAARVSKAFPDKSDVWRYAEAAGLVSEVGLGEEDPPRRILDLGYAIHACAPDEAEPSHGVDGHALPAMIAAGVSPPCAAAAS